MYFIAKTCTETEKTYSRPIIIMMYPARGGSRLGSDDGGYYLKSGGLHPIGGSV